MEILKNFGFDPVILIAQIVNFLIIMYLLKRFLYKPVLELLKKREDAIKTGIKQAEESKKILEETISREKQILRIAQENAKKMIDDAKLQAMDVSKEIEENAKIQTEKMINDAKNRIAEERADMENKLALKVSELASEFLAKSIKEMFGEKEQKNLTEKAIKQIKKAD